MKTSLLTAAVVAGLTVSAAAHAADFSLYPVHAVVLPPSDSPSAPLAALLDRQKAADAFVSELQGRFPNVAATISDSERWKSYAVALQLNRLSRYAVPKPDNTTDLYVAVTSTLYFTNVVTGQNLFTYTSTSYRVKPVLGVPSAVKDEDVRELVGLAYHDALLALLEKAKGRFKPYSKSYRISDRYQDAFVIAGGALDGLRADDELLDDKGSSLRVVYAGDTNAIAEPELGAVDPSRPLTKISNASLSEIKKPGLLVIPQVGSSDFDEQSVGQQFSDVLGDAGPFALTTATPQFASIINTVVGNTGISQQHVIERSLPDYFGVITLDKPAQAELPTNIPHKDLAVSSQAVTFKVLDRSGRVVYADQGAATIKDEVVSGIRFDPQARAEVTMRNALMDVASRTKTLAFTRVQLRVTKADAKGFQVEDPKGVLKPQASVLLLTAVHGGPSPVWAPTWSAHIEATGSETASGVVDLPILRGKPAVRAGDVVEVLQPATSVAANQEFGMCAHAPALGAYDMPDFDDAALVALVRSGKVAIRQPERVVTVLERLAATGQFKSASAPRFGDEPCIEPAQKIDFDPRNCNGATCTIPIHLTAGYRVKKGGSVVFRSALEQTGTSQAFFAPTSDASARTVAEGDVSAMARKLLMGVVAQKSFIDGLGGQ